jgi:hypothetical protein
MAHRKLVDPSLLAALFIGACIGGAAVAQSRTVALDGGTVLTGAGGTIQPGAVAFSEGKITAVGREASAGLLGRRIDVRGMYVTPGFVDVYTTLGLPVTAGPGSPTAHAADGYDRYALDELRGAWRDGVTTIYVPARAATGIGGYGAVIRVGAEEPVLRREAALCANSAAAGPLARAKAFEELRRRFQAARDYRTAWDDYREALKEYEDKLGKQGGDKAASQPAARGEERGDEKRAGQEKGGGERRRREPPPDKAPPPAGRPPEADKKPEPPAAQPKKDDEPKKPQEPNLDRGLEALLRVLNGEVRLRLEAHEPADILNALDLAREFRLALIIDGGTGAHLVADDLARAGVPLAYAPVMESVSYTGGPGRYAVANAAAQLQESGIRLCFGSGVLPATMSSPQLALRVARAQGHGYQAADAVSLVTSEAARFLGVEKDVGRLAPEMNADIVVWSDHPFAPGARVVRVFVGGRQVYRADDLEREEGE